MSEEIPNAEEFSSSKSHQIDDIKNGEEYWPANDMITRHGTESWSSGDVIERIRQIREQKMREELEQIEKKIKEKQIDGLRLMTLGIDHLSKLGLSKNEILALRNTDINNGEELDEITIIMNNMIIKQLKGETIEIKTIENLKHKCLHRFTVDDICNQIKWWIYNDINYKKCLQKTKEVLSDNNFSGNKIIEYSKNRKHIQIILKNDLLTFMAPETYDIIFEYFWMINCENKTADDVGYIMYNIPINNLLRIVQQEKINGATLIEYCRLGLTSWIKESTGWIDNEIYQIIAMFMNHNAFTKEQIHKNMNFSNQVHIDDEKISQKIVTHIFKNCDVEQIHLQMRNGQNTEKFTDTVVNMMDDIIDNDEDKELKKKQIFDAIAGSFLLNVTEEDDDSDDEKYDIDEFDILSHLTKQWYKQWKCNNCSNFNFCNYVSEVMNKNLSICTLCGITANESILLRLKNHDTYVMVNDHENNTEPQQLQKEEIKIDINLHSIIEKKHFQLKCPILNEDKPCPFVLRLAKYLILHQKWVNNTNASVESTTTININNYVSNDRFATICIESAKSIGTISNDDMNLLFNLIDKKTFLSLTRKSFAEMIKQQTKNKIKAAFTVKWYKLILNSLKKEAQINQHGVIISQIAAAANIIDTDFQHIWKCHINEGTAVTIENVLRFFQSVIHYEDIDSLIMNCKSVDRLKERIHLSEEKSSDIQAKIISVIDNINNKEDKHIWFLKQYYIQTQMDIIHSYLAHTDWKYLVNQHLGFPTKTIDVDDNCNKQSETLYENSESILSIERHRQNKNKYVSNYGFGMDYTHTHLDPKYKCMRHELLLNALCYLSVEKFEEQLIKAIRKHKIALSGDYKLICKCYKHEYNILRNSPIGIRHILAVVIYADLTDFCTAFRQTYRRIDDEDEKNATERHQQLYYYARSLFEAVEFFGNEMDTDLQVYHGLNKKMHFNEFAAFFNQPVSTTSSIRAAANFAEGTGIILSLKSGFNVPKYLSISWLSDFPNENERLFYGEKVEFLIHDIIDATDGNRTHSKELFMFNIFQKCIQGQTVEWNQDNNETNKLIDDLVLLIKYVQNINFVENIDDEKDSGHYITPYGRSLFAYYCSNIQEIWINYDHKSLPVKLKNILFSDGNKSNAYKKKFSLIPLVTLFKSLHRVAFIGLRKKTLIDQKQRYVKSVIKYIEQNKSERWINKIVFQSEPQEKDKRNSPLKTLVSNNSGKFEKLQWDLKYSFEADCIHKLLFVRYTASKSISRNEAKQPEHDDKALHDLRADAKDTAACWAYLPWFSND
eukprot:150967_1